MYKEKPLLFLYSLLLIVLKVRSSLEVFLHYMLQMHTKIITAYLNSAKTLRFD
jgi:hypothetical protein